MEPRKEEKEEKESRVIKREGNVITVAFSKKKEVKLSGVGSSFNLFITQIHKKKTKK